MAPSSNRKNSKKSGTVLVDKTPDKTDSPEDSKPAAVADKPAAAAEKPVEAAERTAAAALKPVALAEKPAVRKISFDVKFSATKKPGRKAINVPETTIIQVVILGEPGNQSKRGILFWVVRKEGVDLSCWADKITADLIIQENIEITQNCGVMRKIFKLHDAAGNVLRGNKNYDRRCYLIVVDELPPDDVIRTMMESIAWEVNNFPTIKTTQKIEVPDDFIVEREVPFVAKLGNEQTVDVCEKVFAPLNMLQSYFCQNNEKFENFWKEGTMTAKLAAFFGLGSEWVMPSEKPAESA